MSPYEADAQIAFLLKNGHADLAITEDSDLLAYGCKEVCVNIFTSRILLELSSHKLTQLGYKRLFITTIKNSLSKDLSVRIGL